MTVLYTLEQYQNRLRFHDFYMLTDDQRVSFSYYVCGCHPISGAYQLPCIEYTQFSEN